MCIYLFMHRELVIGKVEECAVQVVWSCRASLGCLRSSDQHTSLPSPRSLFWCRHLMAHHGRAVIYNYINYGSMSQFVLMHLQSLEIISMYNESHLLHRLLATAQCFDFFQTFWYSWLMLVVSGLGAIPPASSIANSPAGLGATGFVPSRTYTERYGE